MRIRVIACAVFRRELDAIVARSPHPITLEWLPQGLHDEGAGVLRQRLQAAIRHEGGWDATVLAYGLCSNALVGLVAPSTPLVLPRTHDCIGIFLGGRQRFADAFQAHPGTYYLTSGWIEHQGRDGAGRNALDLPTQPGGDALDTEALVARFGEDNAAYLVEEYQAAMRGYSRLAFIHMGVEPDGRFEAHARREAVRRGWAFERIAGHLGFLAQLVTGPWNRDDILVVPPRARVVATYDRRLIAAETAP